MKKPLYILIILIVAFVQTYAQGKVSALELVGNTFTWSDYVFEIRVDFVDETTCIISQQFKISNFPEEYKSFSMKCNYKLKYYDEYGITGMNVTKVISGMPQFLKGRGNYVELPLECQKMLNTYPRDIDDGYSKDFYPNGQYRRNFGVIRDYAAPRSFLEMYKHIFHPKALKFFIYPKNEDNLHMFLPVSSQVSMIISYQFTKYKGLSYSFTLKLEDSAQAPRLYNGPSSLVGQVFTTGDYMKEELFFANDTICLYTQQCECMPEGKQTLVTTCTYTFTDGILVLNNKEQSDVNCLPVYQDPSLLSECMNQFYNIYSRRPGDRTIFPDFALEAPTLFNIIRRDTLTVYQGNLRYYKMLQPVGLDPLFIAREYRKAEKTIEDTTLTTNGQDTKPLIIVNY